MIIKIKSDGTVEGIKAFRYFQGSHLTQNITLYAPFDDSYSIAINFRLPDGSNYTGIMEYQSDWQNGDGLHAWVYPIHSYLTAIPGRVEVAFMITQNGRILTTTITSINVEESILDGDLVVIEDPTTLDELLRIIEDKIREEGGKCKVWTESTEPDTAEYDTWFKPIESVDPMSLSQKSDKNLPEFSKYNETLDLPEVERNALINVPWLYQN